MTRKREHWRVEPGDAIGIGIRIPINKIDLALNLFKPAVKRSDIVPPDNYPTFYITTGINTLNGRNTTHKFLNVLCGTMERASCLFEISEGRWKNSRRMSGWILNWGGIMFYSHAFTPHKFY